MVLAARSTRLLVARQIHVLARAKNCSCAHALGRVKPWSRGASDALLAPELPAFKRSLLRLMAAAEGPTCARQCSSTASSRSSGASALRALDYMSGCLAPCQLVFKRSRRYPRTQ